MSDGSAAIYWRLSEQVAFWNGLLLEMKTRGPREVDGERYFVLFYFPPNFFFFSCEART